jgi:acyl-coenzyme A thioesterase PaaI-like protein
MTASACVQERYAPHSICFGCGPANPQGLHVRSFETPEGDELVAEWRALPHHEAFPGILNGGITASLLDCHANWAAALHLMRRNGLEHPPATVTADFQVRLFRPTPTDRIIRLRSRVVESSADDRAVAEAELVVDDRVCAAFQGTFVAVRPGHPAYHRWD